LSAFLFSLARDGVATVCMYVSSFGRFWLHCLLFLCWWEIG
jgi:hypothetical protein